MAQICNDLSPFIFGIEYLRVSVTQPLATSGHSFLHDYNDRLEWQKLLYAFEGTKWAYFARGLLSTDLVIALQICLFYLPTTRLLPALHKLCIQEPDSICREAVVLFIRSRTISGHRIAVEYERLRINELHGNGIAFVQCQFLLLTNALRVGPFCRDQQVTIEMLSADILLNIFHHYLHSSPQIWPMLTHVRRS